MKDKYTDKYGDRVYGEGSIRKRSHINEFGDSNTGTSSINNMRGNSYTDPRSAITEYSKPIAGVEHYLDINGSFKKGKLKVKIEGRGKSRKSYITLDKRLGESSEWKGNPKTRVLEDYICSQINSCMERENGNFYTPQFNIMNYNTLLEIAEKNKEAALGLLSIYNGCSKEIKNLFEKIKEVSQQQKKY